MNYPVYSGGNKCCLSYCTSISFLDNKKGIRFHKFPKDPARCAIWIEKCNPMYLPSCDPSVLTKTYRLCSLHFEDKMYASCNKRTLSTSSIPTLFKISISSSSVDASTSTTIKTGSPNTDNQMTPEIKKGLLFLA